MAMEDTTDIMLTFERDRVIFDLRVGTMVAGRMFIIGPDNHEYCEVHSFPFDRALGIYQNRINAAFNWLEKIVAYDQFGFTFSIHINYDNTIIPNIFTLPNGMITHIGLGGITDVNVLGRVLGELAVGPLESLVIEVPDEIVLRGLADIPLVRTAESLVITGICDFTDETLPNMSCSEVDIKSPFLTQEGMRRHIEKVEQMDPGYLWDIFASFPIDIPPEEMIFLPNGFQPETLRIRTYWGEFWDVLANHDEEDEEYDEFDF